MRAGGKNFPRRPFFFSRDPPSTIGKIHVRSAVPQRRATAHESDSFLVARDALTQSTDARRIAGDARACWTLAAHCSTRHRRHGNRASRASCDA
jgi:hypothetical protein